MKRKFEYPYNLVQEVLELDEQQMEQYIENAPGDLLETINNLLTPTNIGSDGKIHIQYIKGDWRKVLKLIYCFESTLSEVAQEEGFSVETIRSRRKYGIKRLRNTSNVEYYYVRYGQECGDVIFSQVVEEKHEIKRKREEAEYEAALQELGELADKKIINLGFANRTRNALLRRGIATLSDLCYCYNNFGRIKNFGKACIADLIVVLGFWGGNTDNFDYDIDPNLMEKALVDFEVRRAKIKKNKEKKELELKKQEEKIKKQEEKIKNQEEKRQAKEVSLKIIQDTFGWTDEMLNKYKRNPAKNLPDVINYLITTYTTAEEQEAIKLKYNFNYQIVDEVMISNALNKLNKPEIEKIIWFGIDLYQPHNS